MMLTPLVTAVGGLVVAALVAVWLYREIARTSRLGGRIPILIIAFMAVVGFCWWAWFPFLGKRPLPLWAMVLISALLGLVGASSWYVSRSARLRRSREGQRTQDR